jgi:hypothetical protein
VIKAVLGLHHIREALKGGFVSYSYDQYWNQVRELIGHYISKADPKWVSYLLDLIETTTNLAGQNMELQKTDQFFIEHHEIIEKMVEDRNAFLNRLKEKVSILCTMMGETKAATALSQPPRVYRDNCVVLDFKLANTFPIAFDLYLKPTGWELLLFVRNKKFAGYLDTLMNEPALRTLCTNAFRVGDRHIVQTWPIDADLGEIKEALCTWVDALIAAEKSAST